MFEKCKTCKYYQPHFVYMGLNFSPVDGHCKNDVLWKKYKYRRFDLIKDCEYWEENSEVLEERRKEIKDHMKSIDSSLIAIRTYLESENEFKAKS